MPFQIVSDGCIINILCSIFMNVCCGTGSLDELVRHALMALRECLPSDAELTAKVPSFRMLLTTFPSPFRCCVSVRMYLLGLWEKERSLRSMKIVKCNLMYPCHV